MTLVVKQTAPNISAVALLNQHQTPHNIIKCLNTSFCFGYLYCDSPPDLALSAFSTIDQFINRSSIDFTIFTGDIVSHDNDDQFQQSICRIRRNGHLSDIQGTNGKEPIYPTLGNHDSLPEAFNTPNSIADGSNIFSWNYQLLSRSHVAIRWMASRRGR